VGQLSSRRSVVEVVAEAASRGVRYDKYFAIGKFSHHIFSPGYCRSMRAGNNLASLPIFFLHFSLQWCFSILQQVCGDDHLSPDLVRWLRASHVLLPSTCLLSSRNALKAF
jgi:hypothetical protein